MLAAEGIRARAGIGRLALRVAALLALMVLVTACTSGVSGASKGKQLYATNCANCHGDSGARIPAAQLDSQEFIAELGDTGLTKAIAEGKGTMPAWGKARGGPLSDDQIKVVVEYLKTGGDAGPLPTGPGRSLYARQCSGCHGDRGNRIPAADLSVAGFVSSLGTEGLRQSIIDGKGTMPAFGKDRGGPLTDEQARQVADYVKALGRSAGLGLEVSLSAAAKEGKDLYGKNCLNCHGDKGNRIPATPMNDRSYVEKLGEGNLTNAIANGKGTMQAFGKARGGPLSDAQVKSIVVYVNQLAGIATGATQTTSTTATADGKTVYSKNCAACHGDKGNTLSNANLSNKEFIAKVGDGMAQAVLNGMGAMPGFKGKLKDDEVKNLVEYVKSLPGTASSGSTATSGSTAGSSGATGAATQPTGGIPAIPHATAGREQCLTCHAAGGMKPVSASHQGRDNNTCQACHKAGGGSPSLSPSGGTQPAAGPPPITHTLQGREGICLSCHAAGGMKPVPASHQGRDNNSCTGCHQPESGGGTAAAPTTDSGPTASSAPATGAASASGSASGGIPKVPHTVKGREDFCVQCHGPNGIASTFPSDHAGRTNDMCTMCHISTEATSGVATTTVAKKPGPPDVPHKTQGAENQCLGCHGPTGLKPAPANHKDVTNQQCLKCHLISAAQAASVQGTTNVGNTPPKAPDTHAGRTNDTCVRCHDPQFPGIG